jgi:hypothetical protein
MFSRAEAMEGSGRCEKSRRVGHMPKAGGLKISHSNALAAMIGGSARLQADLAGSRPRPRQALPSGSSGVKSREFGLTLRI